MKNNVEFRSWFWESEIERLAAKMSEKMIDDKVKDMPEQERAAMRYRCKYGALRMTGCDESNPSHVTYYATVEPASNACSTEARNLLGRYGSDDRSFAKRLAAAVEDNDLALANVLRIAHNALSDMTSRLGEILGEASDGNA